MIRFIRNLMLSFVITVAGGLLLGYLYNRALTVWHMFDPEQMSLMDFIQ